MHTAFAENADGIMNVDKFYEFAITYDMDNRIVLSAVLSETNMIGGEVTFEEESFFTGKVSGSANLDPRLVGDELIGSILNAPRDFVYTEEGELKRRPYFETSVSNTYPKTSEGVPILPLGVDVEVTITYHDPDDIGFWSQIKEVKIKDRATFIPTPAPVDASKFVDGVYKFNINSAFPGMSRLRAKDTGYLAQFNVLELKYRQG